MAFFESKSQQSLNLFRQKCLQFILELSESHFDLENKFSKINLSFNLNQFNENVSPIMSNGWKLIHTNHVTVYPFIEIELNEFRSCMTREVLEEQDNYWEGLQTKEDMRRSAHFQYMLKVKKVIICPNCRVDEIKSIPGYLVCECGLRLKTKLSTEQISADIHKIMETHSHSCDDLFPQFHKFKSNLTLHCNTCSLNLTII